MKEDGFPTAPRAASARLAAGAEGREAKHHTHAAGSGVTDAGAPGQGPGPLVVLRGDRLPSDAQMSCQRSVPLPLQRRVAWVCLSAPSDFQTPWRPVDAKGREEQENPHTQKSFEAKEASSGQALLSLLYFPRWLIMTNVPKWTIPSTETITP